MKDGHLKVGDHVIIRQDLKPHTNQDARLSFVEDMMPYLGRQAVVMEQYIHSGAPDYFRYCLDTIGWTWLEDWLIPVEETAEDEGPISCMDLL